MSVVDDLDPLQPGAEVDVRLMPQGPLTRRPGVDAVSMVDLGAMAAAVGMERHKVLALVRRVQNNAVQTTLESVPGLLELVREANEARINTLMQAVRALPEASQPVGMLAALRGQQPTVSLVARDAVLALLSAALVQSPPT